MELIQTKIEEKFLDTPVRFIKVLEVQGLSNLLDIETGNEQMFCSYLNEGCGVNPLRETLYHEGFEYVNTLDFYRSLQHTQNHLSTHKYGLIFDQILPFQEEVTFLEFPGDDLDSPRYKRVKGIPKGRNEMSGAYLTLNSGIGINTPYFEIVVPHLFPNHLALSYSPVMGLSESIEYQESKNPPKPRFDMTYEEFDQIVSVVHNLPKGVSTLKNKKELEEALEQQRELNNIPKTFSDEMITFIDDFGKTLEERINR